MVQIAGKPFTQLTNLNVTGEFRVRGTILGQALLSAHSTASSQSPSALDTPVQIEFGAAQDNDFFSLDTSGTVACKRYGFYLFDVDFRVGRNSNAGTSYLHIRATKNGEQITLTRAATLPDLNIRVPLSFVFIAELQPNDVIEFEQYRDSDGVNFGGLFARESTIGWNLSPSAQISIYNFE